MPRVQGYLQEFTGVRAPQPFGKCHVIGTVGGRLAMDHNMGNHILYESLHIDYELLENFYPLIEFNALQYLRNADRLPLGVGGLDYANIGSNDVRGNSTFWGEVGFRRKVVDLRFPHDGPGQRHLRSTCYRQYHRGPVRRWPVYQVQANELNCKKREFS